MKILTTFLESKLILLERSLLKHYGVPDDIAQKADGSYMRHAFKKGWLSAIRRNMTSSHCAGKKEIN
ncbi:MAG TPA: hypothetical protein VI320_26390 [Terracidiphilus sp.]|jgi:hypothetical protein